MSRQKKGVSLTNEQRQRICTFSDSNPKLGQGEVAAWAMKESRLPYAPDQSTISRIVKSGKYRELTDQVKLRSKRTREVKDKGLDGALGAWVLHMESKRVRLSTDFIVQKGKQLL
jgi:hypothetical protein